MRFIAFHLMQAPESCTDAEVYRQETDLMVHAEELGFDAVWVAEHHFHHYCISPDPLLLATHVAARTRRIRIGTAANVVTLTHPLRMAEQAAMVDCLSGGRLDLGLAKGYGPREFAGYGVDLTQASERHREAVELIIGALTKDDFTYHGKHFQVPYPVKIRPRGVQRPHPRIFLATGGTPDTIRLAGRLGLSFYTPYRNRAQLKEVRDIYAVAATAAGRTQQEIDTLLATAAAMENAFVAPTNQESYDEARPAVSWMAEAVRSVNAPEDLDRWPEPQRRLLQAQIERPDRGYEDYDGYWKAFIYGDPGRAAERVQHLKEVGVENVIIGFSYGALPYEKARQSMRLFAEQVMPKFK